MPEPLQSVLERLRKPQAISRPDLGALEAFRQRAPPGILERLGRFLDIPASGVRFAAAGTRGAESGRGVLEEYGILGRNRPGLDFGDILGFGAEVALDPLTYVGGIGVLNKLGQTAKRASYLEEAFKGGLGRAALELGPQRARTIAEAAENLKALTEARKTLRAGGAPARLPKTVAEQTSAGLRPLLRFNVPQLWGTGRELGQIAAKPVVDRIAFATGRLARAPIVAPGVRYLRAVFDPRTFRDRITGGGSELLEQVPEARAYFDAFYGNSSFQALDVRDQKRILEGVEQGLLRDTGRKIEELGPDFSAVRESLGIPKKLADMEVDLRDKFATATKAAFQATAMRQGIRLNREAMDLLQRESSRARGMRQAGTMVKKIDPKLGARLERRALETETGLVEGLERIRRSTYFNPAEKAFHQRATERIETAFNRRLDFIQKEKSRAIAALREAPLPLSFARYLHEKNQALLGREILAGQRQPGNVLRAVTKAYIPRVLTQEARLWLKQSGREEEFARILGKRIASTRTPSQLKRPDELIELFSAEADEFFKQHFSEGPNPFKGAHWFEFDPVKAEPQRWLSGELAMEASKLGIGLAERFSQAHIPSETIELAAFLAKAPVYKFRGLALPKSKDAIHNLLERSGFGGRGIPKAIAEEYLRITEKLSGPAEFRKFLDAYDVVLSFWRTMVTLPIPAFHVRNILSDTALSWIHGGADPRDIPEAMRIAAIPHRAKDGKVFWGDPTALKELEGLNMYRGEMFRDTMSAKGFGQENLYARKIFSRFPALERAAESMEGLGRVAENFTRTWHYLSMRRAGMAPREAAQSVRKALLDYNELTDTERQVFRRVVFFYNWPRKILPNLLKSYFENTGRSALVTRVVAAPTTEREGPLPEYLRQGGSPIPFGVGPEGGRQFLLGSPFPQEEFQKLDPFSPEGGFLGGAAQLGRSFARQLAPTVSIPLEAIFGKDFFTGRDILEEDRASPILAKIPGAKQVFGIEEETLPGGEKRLRADPYLLYLLRHEPFARFFSTLGQALNVSTGEKTWLQNLVRLTTGARVHEIESLEEIRATRDLVQREAQRLIRGGKLREFKRFISRVGVEEETDPETLALLEAQKAVDRLAKEGRKRTPQLGR